MALETLSQSVEYPLGGAQVAGVSGIVTEGYRASFTLARQLAFVDFPSNLGIQTSNGFSYVSELAGKYVTFSKVVGTNIDFTKPNGEPVAAPQAVSKLTVKIDSVVEITAPIGTLPVPGVAQSTPDPYWIVLYDDTQGTQFLDIVIHWTLTY